MIRLVEKNDIPVLLLTLYEVEYEIKLFEWERNYCNDTLLKLITTRKGYNRNYPYSQALHDLARMILLILLEYPTNSLTYANWYLSQNRPLNYASYIAKIACQKMIEHKIGKHEKEFEIVEFNLI
jgi:hypothetical protein